MPSVSSTNSFGMLYAIKIFQLLLIKDKKYPWIRMVLDLEIPLLIYADIDTAYNAALKVPANDS